MLVLTYFTYLQAADAGDAAGDEGIDMSAAIAGIPGL